MWFNVHRSSGAWDGGREGAGVYDGCRGISTNTRSQLVNRPCDTESKPLTFVPQLVRFQWLTFAWIAIAHLCLALCLLGVGPFVALSQLWPCLHIHPNEITTLSCPFQVGQHFHPIELFKQALLLTKATSVASPTGPPSTWLVILQTSFIRLGIFRWTGRGSEDTNAMGDPLAWWVDLSLIKELVYKWSLADTNYRKRIIPLCPFLTHFSPLYSSHPQSPMLKEQFRDWWSSALTAFRQDQENPQLCQLDPPWHL